MNIVVTGGSGTIGSAIINALFEENNNIWNIDVKAPTQSTTAEYINCDVTDYEKLKRIFADIFSSTNIDAVITVAGGGLTSEWNKFADTSIDTIKRSINVNLMGHINVVHAILPFMTHPSSSKSITMISSINAKAAYSMAGYSAAKSGIEGFMYGIIKEMGENNIRVNVVSPGTVVTKLTMTETKKNWVKLRNDTITGQFVSSEDIADAVKMLTQNNSICGQNLVIDSGQLAKA